MTSEEDYRRLAAHATQLANQIFPKTARDHFIEMAQHWTRLARKANSDVLSSQASEKAESPSPIRNADT